MLKHIFLDIDGVLNVGSTWFLKAAGVDIDPVDIDRCPPYWDLVKSANEMRAKQGLPPLTKAEFWKTNSNHEFWANFPVSPEADFIISKSVELVGEENVFLLSSPTLSPESLSGKLSWIHRYMPRFLHRQFLIGPHKHVCAQPGVLLIDDYDENVDKFIDNHGDAILVPRPWNSYRHLDTLTHLRTQLNKYEARVTSAC